ncbi:phage major capsid protein [Protaetiibacter larvae]|uniref:Phage major capsid protein n=1 Tax=Protaetiibacter larvae TaxID=2592654 RepID=A0A5C1YBP6_9MICO|nr:phage major capsid protein [Protaetiibacter larvae]QEO10559.1 phage major capsid protein [Protaetiibacter larvae]
MDTKSTLRAELSALQIKLSAAVEAAKSSGRDLTPSEADAIERGSERAVEIKAQLNAIERGEKNAALMAGAGAGDYGFDAGINGRQHAEQSPAGAKGFITPASIKSMTSAVAARGIKALVAGGSSTTAVALATDPIPLGQPNLGLLSLIPTKVRETPNYKYLRQTVRTNNAAVVAAGGTKPTSVYTVAEVAGALQVVAHLSEYVDKYLLDDNDDLERFLAGELQDGVIRKVTANAIAAFAATSGIQTQAFTDTAADSIYAGASKVSDLGYSPSLVILNVADYDAIRLSKDAEGRYFGGSPFEGGARPGVWGFNTLISADQAAGEALVLDTSKVGISTDREGIQTVWDAISGFDTNRVRARTEGRFATDVFSPAAVAKVTLTDA